MRVGGLGVASEINKITKINEYATSFIRLRGFGGVCKGGVWCG